MTTNPLTAEERKAISPSDLKTIIAGIRQFGLAPDGSDLRDLEAAIDRLTAPTPREALEALRQGAAWFREYEQMHRGKGPSGFEKARRNADRAAHLEAALASVAGGESDLSPTDYYHGFYRGDERGNTPTDAEERAREIVRRWEAQADIGPSHSAERSSALKDAITEALAAEKARGDRLEIKLALADEYLRRDGDAIRSFRAEIAAFKAERNRLRRAAVKAETVMSVVEPRSDKKQYLVALTELRAALTKSEENR